MFDPEYGELPDAAFAPRAGNAIPARLDEMPPGVMLAAILEAVDVTELSGHDRITFLRAQQRMASHYSAGVYQAMAAVKDHMRSDKDNLDNHLLATEAAAAEIRAALRLTRRATDAELSFAIELQERLPRVWSALAAGDIDVRRAKTIARYTLHLTAATARGVVDEMIDIAPQLTSGQLAARLKQACIEANPNEAADRYESAVERRRVYAEPTVDGTSHIAAYDAPPDAVARAMRRINGIARSLRRNGETRTMDQLRTDVLLDLLSGGSSGEDVNVPRGIIDLRIDLATLAELDDKPGELGGYGPVIADVARRVADESPDAEWRWTITDPDSGRPIGGGTTRRRHTRQERREVQSRDRTCVFPGCRMPATECDIDHSIPFSVGGPTDARHAGPLCRRDHTTRHNHAWSYERLPDGDYIWTTKLGHTYTTSGRSP